MGEHRRDDGQELIEWLVMFGRALGYWVEREWTVGGSAGNAQADLVWHRRPDSREPLFIFEVETSGIGRLVGNAAKVLSGPTAELAKPLYLFHLVQHGGQRSARAQIAANTFPNANYRVFLLDNATDGDRFVADVLTQHARVAEFIVVHALADALMAAPFEGPDINARLRQVQTAGLIAPYASDYADLTHSDRSFAPHLVHALLPELNGHRPPCQYGTWFGESLASPLHLGLITSLEPTLGPRCLDALERWQSETTIRPAIAPAVGLSRDYDDLVFAYAPYLWALVAALMRAIPGAVDFVARQLRRVIDGGPSAPLSVTGLTALWLLHVAAAESLVDDFEAARQHVNARGGAPLELQRSPPWVAGTTDALDDWSDELADAPVPVVPLSDFKSATITEPPRGADPVDLALELLLGDRPADEGSDLVDWLHRKVAVPAR